MCLAVLIGPNHHLQGIMGTMMVFFSILIGPKHNLQGIMGTMLVFNRLK